MAVSDPLKIAASGMLARSRRLAGCYLCQCGQDVGGMVRLVAHAPSLDEVRPQARVLEASLRTGVLLKIAAEDDGWLVPDAVAGRCAVSGPCSGDFASDSRAADYCGGGREGR